MAAKVTIDSQNYGKLARALQQRLGSLGLEIKLGQAYEALAALAGDANWHVLKAKLEAPVREARATAPVREDATLAGALAEAASAALSAGRITAAEAEAISAAARGEGAAVARLAKECGHVVVASIPVDAEIKRWHDHSGDFLELHTGDRAPFTRESLADAAAEYAAGADYTRRATGDFFSDWLYERVQEGGWIPGNGPR